MVTGPGTTVHVGDRGVDTRAVGDVHDVALRTAPGRVDLLDRGIHLFALEIVLHHVRTFGCEADAAQAHALLHGEETDVLGDTGYHRVHERDGNKDRGINWHVAMRLGE